MIFNKVLCVIFNFGNNLADAGRITYDRTYYAEGGRCLKFERHKTHRNVNGEATVIVPIITPLQNVTKILGSEFPDSTSMPMWSLS